MSAVVYLVLCILVACFGIGYRGGFLLYFILSLALTPLVGSWCWSSSVRGTGRSGAG